MRDDHGPERSGGRRGAAHRPLVSRVAVVVGLLSVAGCGGVYRRPPDTTPRPQAGVATLGTGELRDVVLVGNNWAGTVTVFDPRTFDTLAVIDVVPDWN